MSLKTIKVGKYNTNNKNFRKIWQLRYRLYALVVILVLMPVLYSANTPIPEQVDAIGYEVLKTNLLAVKIRKKPVQKPVIPNLAKDEKNKEKNTQENNNLDSKNSWSLKEATGVVDIKGYLITEQLKQSGYDLGFISSTALLDLGLEVPIKIEDLDKEKLKEKIEKIQENKPKSLDELIKIPESPERVNFLRYPAYNINAPIIYSDLKDLFKTNEDGTINFNEPADMSSIDTPLQRKLEKGVVHMAFTPQPGEIGNSYIVGHSSNYPSVKSNYNTVFKPIEERSKKGEEFYIYDRFGRELKFRVFEVLKIAESDTREAYRNFPDRRVVTLQTSILGWDPEIGAIGPTHRWLTRGELVLDNLDNS